MLVTFALLVGLAVIPLLLGWLGAESRPGFLDPEAKPDPFVAPIREEHIRR